MALIQRFRHGRVVPERINKRGTVEELRLQERRMGRDNAAPRQMTLVAFLQAANCSNYPASWRHPATAPDFLSAAYFQRLAGPSKRASFI